MKLLSVSHQDLLSQANAEALIAAVEAVGVTITRTKDGFTVSDENAAIAAFTSEPSWLPFAKASLLISLQAKFDAIIAAGRIIGAKTYQIDDASCAAMQQQFNSNTWPITWITADNSTISLTQVQFQSGCRNVLDYIRAIRLNFRALKDNIKNASTFAVLNAVNINAGWPSN